MKPLSPSTLLSDLDLRCIDPTSTIYVEPRGGDGTVTGMNSTDEMYENWIPSKILSLIQLKKCTFDLLKIPSFRVMKVALRAKALSIAAAKPVRATLMRSRP